MTRYFTTIILLVFSFHSLGQENAFRADIRSGGSIPLGKFSSTASDGGSFAQAGWSVGAEGAWSIFKGLGLGVQAAYRAHPVDVVLLAEEKVKADPFLEDLVIRSDPYRVITLAAFVEHFFQITKQITLTPKIGTGAALGISPYQLYKPQYFLVGSKWYEITSTRDWSLYSTTGVDVRYHLNECIDLVLGAELGYSRLVYRFLTGTGDIREDVHHVLFLDGLAGISIKF